MTERRRGLTIKAYAEHRGVSRQAVYKALKNGWIRKETDGTIDPYLADRAWDRATGKAPKREQQAYNGGGVSGGGIGDVAPITIARERLQEAKAQQAELDLQKRQGKLVDADAVARLWHDAGVMLRRRLHNIPKRNAGRLATLDDEHAIIDLLEREIDAALAAAADAVPGLVKPAE